jgi:hypothetical protein
VKAFLMVGTGQQLNDAKRQSVAVDVAAGEPAPARGMAAIDQLTEQTSQFAGSH